MSLVDTAMASRVLELQCSCNTRTYAQSKGMLQMAISRPTPVLHSGRPCPHGATSKRRQSAARCKLPDRDEPATPWADLSEAIVDSSEMPAFLVVQGLLGLAFLALMDGGFSGTSPALLCHEPHVYTCLT